MYYELNDIVLKKNVMTCEYMLTFDIMGVPETGDEQVSHLMANFGRINPSKYDFTFSEYDEKTGDLDIVVGPLVNSINKYAIKDNATYVIRITIDDNNLDIWECTGGFATRGTVIDLSDRAEAVQKLIAFYPLWIWVKEQEKELTHELTRSVEN